MTFGEIMRFLDGWLETFGDMIETFSVRLGDIVGPVLGVIIPASVKDYTILGVMFNAGFGAFVGWTVWHWIKKMVSS